ncbi:MAG: zinc-ribbon domain-containing protein [Candidatus Poseidoniaceae archaeon]|nr:zinc-ribbon domain-containing protein [Candidatus Poseidoniaceae archaeon]
MQPNRGDQLVVAGMKPNSLVARNSVFDRIHRGTTFIVFIDGLIVMYLFWAIASIISPTLSKLVLGFVAVVCYMTWNSYRSKVAWAYWPAAILICIAGLFFALNALDSIIFVISGNVGGLLFLFLTGWASIGSFRRFMYHFNPLYKSGYFNVESDGIDFQLEQGEMLAACPKCMAVLAIRPSMLSASDRCPHCQAPLIDPNLAAKYGLTEEE